MAYSVSICIADLTVTVWSDEAAMIERVRARYQAFLCDAATPHASLFLHIEADAQYIEPEQGTTWVTDITVENNHLHYVSYLEKAVLDLATNVAHVTMAPHAEIENFLRVLYAWLCLQHDSILLHAAGIVRNGLGYVFFGPSGAGKSTVAGISAELPNTQILSDDLVIIRKKDAQYELCGVPFLGEMAEAPRLNRQVPLKGLFRLKQGFVEGIRPIPKSLAIAELAAAAPFVVQHSNLGNRLIDVCALLNDYAPVHELQFKRTPTFWDLINGNFEHLP